jgi:hypothetical protein
MTTSNSSMVPCLPNRERGTALMGHSKTYPRLIQEDLSKAEKAATGSRKNHA